MIATYTKGSLVFHYESIVLLFHWTSTVLLHLLQNTEQSERKKKTKKQGAPSRWAWAGGWESAFSRRTGLWEMGKREGPDPSWENGLSTYLYIFIQPLLFDLLSAAEQF